MAQDETKKRWKYDTKTETSVKTALRRLLAEKPLSEVTVSELAREASISRSTFYEHYGNPAEVYDELIDDMGDLVSPMIEEVACSDGFRPSGKPFCALVRDGEGFASIVDEERFLSSFLARSGDLREHDLHAILMHAGYTDMQARAVCAFQLSGCFSAARTINAADEEWGEIRAVIDRFILGGISACLAAKRAQE